MAGSHRSNTNQSAIGNWPVVRENHWYALAISSAIFTAIAILSSFIWIFGDGFDGDTDVKAAQALSPFGVALFALVTFCTVGWRGTINTRQVDQAEREGRAKLLQEGAKLLGESNNYSHVSAGIATLEILITGPDEKLAVQAMNLVANYIQNEMGSSHAHRFRDEAFSALSNGSKIGREASRTVRFSATALNEEEDAPENWFALHGVKLVQYFGGQIEGGWLGDFIDSNRFTYTEVRILFLEDVVLSTRFKDCVFRYCDIASFRRKFGARAGKTSFSHCDFSRCNFGDLAPPPDFKSGQNYYYEDKEPISSIEPKPHWPDFLLKKDA